MFDHDRCIIKGPPITCDIGVLYHPVMDIKVIYIWISDVANWFLLLSLIDPSSIGLDLATSEQLSI